MFICSESNVIEKSPLYPFISGMLVKYKQANKLIMLYSRIIIRRAHFKAIFEYIYRYRSHEITNQDRSKPSYSVMKARSLRPFD